MVTEMTMLDIAFEQCDGNGDSWAFYHNPEGVYPGVHNLHD